MHACVALVEGDHGPYMAYWRRRVAGTAYHTPEAEASRPSYMHGLVAAIRDGTAPHTIRVTRDRKGNLWPWDGSHRACILKALNRPVPYTIHNP